MPHDTQQCARLGASCSVNVAVSIFGSPHFYFYPAECKHGHPDKLFQYCSTDIDSLVQGHLGVEEARRDDLESLTYVLMYFLHGALPASLKPSSCASPLYWED